MGGHPLRSPTRPRLGRPLPYQLADGPQPPPSAPKPFLTRPLTRASVWGISHRFQRLSPSEGQVSYVLLTRSPLSPQPKSRLPFDLHVLGTPPAFILSQDQTLRYFSFIPSFKDMLFFCSPESIWFVSSFLLLLNCQGSSRPSVSQAQRLIICVSVISSRLFFEKSLRSFFLFSRPP